MSEKAAKRKTPKERKKWEMYKVKPKKEEKKTEKKEMKQHHLYLYKKTFSDARALLKLTVPIKAMIEIPDQRESLNEWLAVNTQDFFNQINIIHLLSSEFCNDTSCPSMTAGPKYEYLWSDETTKRPEKLSAPKHIEALLSWAHNILNETSLFPPLVEKTPFPENFVDAIKPVYKRLFRVYCHIYYHHFLELHALGAEGHLNTCFLHFYCFIEEFQLVAEKELRPLRSLAESLKKYEATQLNKNNEKN